MKKDLTESLETYLIAIYEVEKKHKEGARIKDIAKSLKFGGPSVSEAVKQLGNKGYVNYKPYMPITLSRKGLAKVQNKLKRLDIIKNFVSNVLFLPPNQLEKNAKLMEYSVSDYVVGKMELFLEFMENRSEQDKKVVEGFRDYVANPKNADVNSTQSCLEIFEEE